MKSACALLRCCLPMPPIIRTLYFTKCFFCSILCLTCCTSAFESSFSLAHTALLTIHVTQLFIWPPCKFFLLLIQSLYLYCKCYMYVFWNFNDFDLLIGCLCDSYFLSPYEWFVYDLNYHFRKSWEIKARFYYAMNQQNDKFTIWSVFLIL